MNWALRIFLVLGFSSLAALAAWPYFPALQTEWAHFKAAWAEVRTKEKPSDTSAEPPPVERLGTRNRQVAIPEKVSDSIAKPGIPDDRFLAETRRRAERDPEAAMAWLQTQSTTDDRLRGMLEVVALWAAEDSESALLWLESNAQGIARFETLNSGIELWAARDPENAAAWVEGMANDGSKLTAAESLAAAWARSDPPLAAQWVRGLEHGPIRQQAAAAMTDAWAQKDPQAASVWALAEAEFNGATELLQIAVERYTEKDPEAAAAFLREMAVATDASAVLAQHVKTRAEDDPAATAAWLETLPSDDPIAAPQNARSLMQTWATSDSIAASEWMSRQPAGPKRDAAIAGFTESIQDFEPAAAATWANAIDDPELRTNRLRSSIGRWADVDPDAAKDWLNRAELAPAFRSELAQQLSRD
jgi:hypothetical protein